MRVISGTARGLKLVAPEGLDTRPTTDRVKESIFNIIQSYIPCENVLDLFAGSGALGIEALSRGCRKCTFVDNNKYSFDLVKLNTEKAKISDKADFYKTDSISFLNSCSEKFDIIFLDPPYNKGFLCKSFDVIADKEILKGDGIIVAETEYGGEIPENSAFKCIKSAKYGNTLVLVYKTDTNE